MEDYVSYKQAVKLKELGFDWDCNHWYHPLEEDRTKRFYADCCNHNKYKTAISAPTLSQAQKWLREVKDIILVANIKFHKGKVKYSWYIVTDNGNRGICDDIEKSIFDTYEKALSIGIDKALEFLKRKQ